MKIHYFYKRSYYPGIHNLCLIAWLEENVTLIRRGTRSLSFTQLEKLRIVLSNSPQYYNRTIEHDFGNNSCIIHAAHSRKELTTDMEEQGFVPINRRNYERFRKVALALYLKQPLVDFSSFEGEQKYSVCIIGETDKSSPKSEQP